MGTSANNQQTTNYKNTLFGFTLFLGRKFSDPFVQREMKEVPFEVVQLPNDGVGFKVCVCATTPETTSLQLLDPLETVAALLYKLIIGIYLKILILHPSN